MGKYLLSAGGLVSVPMLSYEKGSYLSWSEKFGFRLNKELLFIFVLSF